MTFSTSLKLPNYEQFSEEVSPLNLSISISTLHGIICGYLSTGATKQGETYLHALMDPQKTNAYRTAARALFNIFTITEQQICQQNYAFELFIPEDEHTPLTIRAQAFSDWCQGYIQAVTSTGMISDHLKDEETKEALQHISEFAELDYQNIEISEEDEHSFMELCEYTRMAIMHIYTDLQRNPLYKSDDINSH